MTTPNLTEPPALPGPDVAGDGMYIAYWAQLLPDHPAVVDGDRTVSFHALNAAANQLVRALRAEGAPDGAVVGVMARNCLGWAVIMAAVERAGMCFVPINWHLAADEVAYIADDSGMAYLFHDIESTDVAHEVAARTGLRRTWCVDRPTADGTSELDALLMPHDGADITDPSFGTRMAYTSGTTGRPKAVQRSGADQRERAMEYAALGRHPVDVTYVPGHDIHLATGPLYHAGPGFQSLVVPLHAGVTVVMMRTWDNEQFLTLVERHRVTHAHMAPIMFHRLLRLPESERRRYDLSSLVQLRHGGAACPVPVKQAMIDWVGPVVDEYYGSTEGAVVNVTAEEWLRKPGTVGHVDPPGRVIIVGDDGEEVGTGVVGTIYTRARPGQRFEYRGDPAKTAAAFRGDHYTVGDVGYLDDDGYLFLTDRSVDLIVSGGVNIYPAEIEAVLGDHPGVRDAAVVGVPNEEWGEEVWAAIQPADPDADFELLEQALRELCHERMARFKCPRRFVLEPELPREDSGKLFKRHLRDRYRAAVSAGDPA